MQPAPCPRRPRPTVWPCVRTTACPPFDQDGPPLSFFEFWPMWAFYPPVMAYAAWLMLRYRGVLLPTAANPSFPGGGFFGESKADILDLAMQPHPRVGGAVHPGGPAPSSARQRLIRRVRCRAGRAAAAGLGLPVVAKPDLGCRGAGVKLVRTADDLRAYLQAFPAGAIAGFAAPGALRGRGRHLLLPPPGPGRGRIVSITLKYFPHVVGDGQRTLRQLILDDPRAGRLSHLYLKRHVARLDTVPPAGQAIRLAFAGSHSRGAIFRNGTHLVTPEMEARFDAIAKSLPEFHFGRFDLRFESFAQVQQGQGFTIVESQRRRRRKHAHLGPQAPACCRPGAT